MKHLQKLLSLALSLCLAFPLSACRQTPSATVSLSSSPDSEKESASVTVLQETEDRGQAYLDSFIFFGESTTYHLKSRGVLSGGTATTQVWGTDSGTVTLDSTIPLLKIRYPDTGETIPLVEAVQRKQPPYLLLTFGLNGAPGFIKRGKDYFQSCYRSLLDAIRSASPDTSIILQSCFPVAATMDMRHYSVTAAQLNEQIRTINEWTLELARTYELRYLNTAEILTDADGYLFSDMENGDGYHLTKSAYVKILHYIRTHGYQ